ncbi:hypothetical protein GOP47_0031166, partial [Adiantum capillus-veneris]
MRVFMSLAYILLGCIKEGFGGATNHVSWKVGSACTGLGRVDCLDRGDNWSSKVM